MKHGATSKLKFKKLDRALGDLPQYQVVGLLESLWQFTAADAPLGDVGKFTNEDIATAIDWKGDPDKLIEALVETGWLDESDEFRLVVHHWHEHCPDYLRKRIQRRGKSFVTEPNRQLEPANRPPSDTGRHRQTAAASGCLPNQTEPDQTQPNPTEANRTEPARRTPPRGEVVPGKSSLSGDSVSGVQKKPDSDSGTSGEAARQIEDLRVHNAKCRIAEALRITPPENHPEGSRNRKQASGDCVTISKAVEHWRGDPTTIETLERLASEVGSGKLINKPAAAWVKRLKDAGLFYK